MSLARQVKAECPDCLIVAGLTECSTYSTDDWCRMNLFAVFVAALHGRGCADRTTFTLVRLRRAAVEVTV